MEKQSATLEVDMSTVTMKSPSKAKAVLGKGYQEADGTNLSSSYETIDEKASTFVIDVRGGRRNKVQP